MIFLLLIPALAKAVDIVQLPPLVFRTGYCGDGFCDEAETCNDCPVDCGLCEIPLGTSIIMIIPLAVLILYIFIKRKKGARPKETIIISSTS